MILESRKQLFREMASETGGVKAFSIQGRLYRERERLAGMTDKERAWRRQWIRDQHLAPDEPRFVPEMHKELYNPIRRAYWKPLDAIFKALEPVLVSSFVRKISFNLQNVLIDCREPFSASCWPFCSTIPQI